MFGGYLSPRVGSVDLLQLPKSTIMYGYRFQDSLIPPEPWRSSTQRQGGLSPPTDPLDIQRVGIFKEKAYMDEGGGTQYHTKGGEASLPLVETYVNNSIGAITQLQSRGEQDHYLSGSSGDPIEDSDRPFSSTVILARPIRIPGHPNPFFTWGDVLLRYKGEFSLT
jgi:hypothetical protein